MAAPDATARSGQHAEKLRQDWLARLSDLLETVRNWARELDWSTRQVGKKMNDSEVGNYEAPALILQKETTRAMLEPIARTAPGTEGIVDLYLMPAFDDIASLYYYDSAWHVRYTDCASSVSPDGQADELRVLSKETLQKVLQAMIQHAA